MSLAQIYNALSYYSDHPIEIDEYIVHYRVHAQPLEQIR